MFLSRLSFFTIIFSVSYSNIYEPCQFDGRCRCRTKRTQYVNCSDSNMTRVPLFPSSVLSLNLQKNLIETIQNNAFENLKNLTELDLSGNRMTYLEPGAFIGLHNLKILVMENNRLNYNLSSFPVGVFQPLTSLVYLNVKFNINFFVDCEKFPDTVISDLTSLKSLDVDACTNSKHLEVFGQGFSTLYNLTKVKTGRCGLFYLNNNTFSNLKYLEHFDISGCFTRYYDTCTFCNKTLLKYLDISKVAFVEPFAFETFLSDLQTSTLETFVMTNTFQHVADLPVDFFNRLYGTGIRYLRADHNYLVKARGMFFSDTLPPTLEYADFSNNDLMEFWFNMPYLISLNLQNNSLGFFLAEYSYNNFTETNLKYLDVSFNRIYSLQYSIFQKHPQLETIKLNDNILSDVTFDLSQMPKLKLLDLSGNRITAFSSQTIMDSISKSDMIINLSNNILLCNCQTYPFLKWMVTNTRHFHKPNTYICKYDNGSIFVLDKFTKTMSHLERHCSSYTALTVGVSLGIVIACVILVIGLIYRYRWKLRYMYYMARSRYNRYTPLHNGHHDKNGDSYREHKYDAFISYSDDDRGFVVTECIPNLEQNGQLRLCIHHRDFTPGQDISFNITSAIQESKKVICIVTKSFLDSYYCMFEFNMAKMESIYSRNEQNILFLIFYEQIQPRDLPLVMLELVQEQSYLEYPNDEYGNVLFWDKIKEALN